MCIKVSEYAVLVRSMLPEFRQEWLDLIDVECLCLHLSFGEILSDVVWFEALDSQFC